MTHIWRVIFSITIASAACAGGLTMRSFVLRHTTAERLIARLTAQPRLAERVDVDGLSPGSDPHTLVAVGSEARMAALVECLGVLDADSGRIPVVLPVSFLSREELEPALRALGADALGGLDPGEIAYLPAGHGVAVNGTPDQVQRVKAVLAQIDVAPVSVTIGVASASASSERTRASGVGLDGTVAHDRSASKSNQSGVVWVTTLSGSPAHIALQQVFNVALTQSVSTAGGTLSSQAVNEVPVGLALEVTPRVMGDAVQVEVSLVDSAATRVSDIGVDRSERAVLTTVRVPRGGSAQIGGMETALEDSSRPDALGLLSAARERRQSLSLTLFVK